MFDRFHGRDMLDAQVNLSTRLLLRRMLILVLLTPGLTLSQETQTESSEINQRRIELNRECNEAWKNGNVADALKIGQQLLNVESKQFGSTHLRVAERYTLLSNYALELNQLKQAKDFAQHAVHIYRENSTPDSWQHSEADRLESVTDILIERPLADRQELYNWDRQLQLSLEQLDFVPALEAAENLARLNRDYFGDRHPRSIVAMALIQYVQMLSGNPPTVRDQLERLRIELLQVEHPKHSHHALLSYLLAQNAIGNGEFEKSLQYSTDALKQYQGPGSTQMIRYDSLAGFNGFLLLQSGRLQEALVMLRKAYQFAKHEGIPDQELQYLADPLISTLEQVATANWEQQNWETANQLLTEAETISAENWDSGNFRAVNVRIDLSMASRAQKWTNEQRLKYEEAKTLHQQKDQFIQSNELLRALEASKQRYDIYVVLFGRTNGATLRARYDVLKLFTHPNLEAPQDQRLDISQITEFLRVMVQEFGTEHAEYGDACLYFVSRINNASDDLTQELIESAVQSYRSSYGEDSTLYLHSLTVLGCVKAENFDEEAIEILTQAVELWESRAGSGSYDHGQAAASLGALYYNLDDIFASRIHLARAEEIFRAINADYVAYDLALVLNYLGNVAAYHGRTDDSSKYYNAAIELFESHSHHTVTTEYGKSLADFTATYQWCLYNGANACISLGQYQKAEELLNKLIKRFEDSSSDAAFRNALYSQAIVYAHQARSDAAQKLLDHVSQIINEHHRNDSLVHGHFHLISGNVAIILDQKQQAMQQLDQALSEFQKIKDVTQLDRIDWGFLDTYLLRLREHFEELQAWKRVVEVRRFARDSEAILYADDEDLLMTLKRELELAERVANLSPEPLAAYQQMRHDTAAFKDMSDSKVKEDFILRSEELINASAESLGNNNLAMMNYAQAAAAYFEKHEHYKQAINANSLALACGMELFGMQHSVFPPIAIRQSRLLRAQGEYQTALELAKYCVEETGNYLGDGHFDTYNARFELAHVYADIEDYTQALPLVRSASAGFRRLWGEENKEYANSVRLLGEIYYRIGEPALAHAEILRSHQIIQRLSGISDHERLRSAAAVAVSLATDKRRENDAREQFEKVIAEYESAELTKRSDYVELLIAYGDTLLNAGDVSQATMLLERAYEDFTQRSNSPSLLQELQQKLGIAQRKSGQLDSAHKNLSQALVLQQQLFGPESKAAAETLFQLAVVEYLQGHNDSALSKVEQSLQLQQRQLSELGSLLSDSSLTSLLDQEESPLDLLISILTRKMPTETEIQTALNWTIQRKGLALDLNCRMKSIEQSQSFDSQTLRLIENVRIKNQELADLTLRPDDTTPEAKLESARRHKRQEISELQGQLAQRLRNTDSNIGNLASVVEQFAAKLKNGEAYLDYLKGHRLSSEMRTDVYLAFLIRKENDELIIDFADLGDAVPIDELIEELREQTRRFPRNLRLSTEEELEKKYRQLAQQLYAELLEPFSEGLESVAVLTISPDAELSKVPFAALVNPDNQYFVEKINISYVSSARDLFRENEPAGVGTLVISNPNFDAEIEDRENALSVERIPAPNMLALRGADDIDLRSLRWKRLPGAEAEAADLQSLLASSEFQPVTVYLGDEAVEDVFKSVHSARLVHLATHGFYVPSAQEDEFGLGFGRSTSNLSRLRSAENPLLRSGIVLAGANRSSQKSGSTHKLDDGWVTAQEIARLDFRNTELVVLSACESGLGDVSAGQGVHGIRRAFLNAGAHSVLTTLFEVPDGETRELMKAFYEQMLSQTNRRAALCEAQRQQIATRRMKHQAAHPFYWASFMLLGDPE